MGNGGKERSNGVNKINLDYGGEFGVELQLVVPYAYYLHTKNLLGKTLSAHDTKALYYFSEEHEEKYDHRVHVPQENLKQSGNPNPSAHTYCLKTSQWLPPPYKQKYRNDRFKWKKEPLIISNKYAIEWGQQPFNFIDLPTLGKILKLIEKDYQVIYCRPTGKEIVSDQNEIVPLRDFELIREHPEVLTIQELSKRNPDLSFNALQMMIFANCKKFISVQGGNAVLASYFGGTNIIYAIKGQELSCGDFNHYGLYGRTNIVPCANYSDFLSCIKALYVSKGNWFADRLKRNAVLISQMMRYNTPIVKRLAKEALLRAIKRLNKNKTY